jgi:hypothetical protein
MEEFLDADLTLEDLGLHPLFNIEFDVNHICGLSDAETSQILGVTVSDL